VGTVYCSPANPNSTGLPARLSSHGSHVAADDDVTFDVDQLPANKPGYFLMSPTQAAIPVEAGVLCMGGPTYRFRHFVLSSGTTGTVSFSPDLANPPSGAPVVGGETWNFQLWYRDGASMTNFSDAVSILFR
jgi:hypothetical protein